MTRELRVYLSLSERIDITRHTGYIANYSIRIAEGKKASSDQLIIYSATVYADSENYH